jgi:hypothetical protein
VFEVLFERTDAAVNLRYGNFAFHNCEKEEI